jgi:glycosyltransferase involved in cell wall biosynthesis
LSDSLGLCKIDILQDRQLLTYAFLLPCYNEATNLPALLPLLERTRVHGRAAERFIIVSDASRDGTDEVVRRFAETSSIPVQLIRNPERGGKSAAINQGLTHLGKIDIVVMISGDVLPDADCIRLLVEAFEDPAVGVAGARQVPVGPAGNLASDISRFMWALHHVIATRHPKTTEVTVFRNVIKRIDGTSLVDEAAIECAAREGGYVVRYIPNAKIFTATPLTLSDYIRQRSTVTLGYLRLRQTRGHVMHTHRITERLRAIGTVRREQKFPLRTIMAAIIIEALVRVSGWIQFLRRRQQNGIWGRSSSTKRALRLQTTS